VERVVRIGDAEIGGSTTHRRRRHPPAEATIPR
jgi:hypothetical protein